MTPDLPRPPSPQPTRVGRRTPHWALWSPGLALFSRMRFRAKAALISFVLFVPIVVFGLAYLETVQEQVTFARKERTGLAAMQALVPVLRGVLETRNTVRAGLGGLDVQAAYRAARASTDAALAAMDAQRQTSGDPLSLAGAQTQLREAWAASAAQGLAADAQGRTAYGPVIQAQQALLLAITDASGLVLDPDLDSFYTINGLFMVLPHLVDDLGQVWGWATYGVAKGGLDNPEQYRRLAVWNARSGAALEDLATAFERARKANPALDTALDLKALVPASKFNQSADPTELVKAAATPEEVFKEGAAALAATLAVYDRALPALEGLLAQRQSSLERGRNLKTGLALACALLAIYLFVSFRLVLEDAFRELSHHMHALAEGDLSAAPQPHGSDETADLLRDLQRTQAALVGIVGDVRGASDGIVTATEEIASGSSHLSGRTEQAAAQLQETASSVAVISGHVSDTARQAQAASAIARRNAEQAGQGGAVVSEVVQTMARMQDASRRIGDINNTIDAIAFQTNILALNAAVEAARAGEQGRGFAVVASEVRSLAQRSATAAREIKGLISSNAELTSQGAQAVQRAGSSMGELVGHAEQIRELLDGVAQASQQQTAGVDGVALSVQGLDGMTQQNTALAEETAAASDALRCQAQALLDCVARFKLPA